MLSKKAKTLTSKAFILFSPGVLPRSCDRLIALAEKQGKVIFLSVVFQPTEGLF